jgi:hypothetical protein
MRTLPNIFTLQDDGNDEEMLKQIRYRNATLVGNPSCNTSHFRQGDLGDLGDFVAGTTTPSLRRNIAIFLRHSDTAWSVLKSPKSPMSPTP